MPLKACVVSEGRSALDGLRDVTAMRTGDGAKSPQDRLEGFESKLNCDVTLAGGSASCFRRIGYVRGVTPAEFGALQAAGG
ncbi:MAG: hypothetical protein QOJ86_504 [Bradyrhizobium sp.]|jgi:hypothetical protein|nr:hypothetical protein [Bradyrhizobium sp.]